jgi:hypothetical protein
MEQQVDLSNYGTDFSIVEKRLESERPRATMGEVYLDEK